jgi:hypothetical protein
MAIEHKPSPEQLSEVIDEIEEIRERLLGIQRHLEQIEPAPPQPTGE